MKPVFADRGRHAGGEEQGSGEFLAGGLAMRYGVVEPGAAVVHFWTSLIVLGVVAGIGAG